MPLQRLDFGRKRVEDNSSRGASASASRTSKKSVSLRGKKPANAPATPDCRTKSKSRKKLTLKAPERSSKMVDTEKLYFEMPVSRVEEKTDIRGGKEVGGKEGGGKEAGSKAPLELAKGGRKMVKR